VADILLEVEGSIICKSPISNVQLGNIREWLSVRKWKLDVLLSDDTNFQGYFSAIFLVQGFSVQFEIQESSLFITADFPHTIFQDFSTIKKEIRGVTKELAQQLKGSSSFNISGGPEMDLDANEEFDAPVAKLTLDQYWEKIRESGWLNNLDEKSVRAIKRGLSEIFPEAPLQAADCLACHEVDFNDFGESYTAVLKDLSKASGNAFRPHKIKEIIEEAGTTQVSFIHDDRPYGTTLREGRVDDFGIFTLVNKALRDSKSPRLFGFMNMGAVQDDRIRIVFVSEAVFEEAQQLGVLPLQGEESFL
jgi:hypothetical protein